MANKLNAKAAAEHNRLPSWNSLDKKEKILLVQQILQAIAEMKPLPERMLQPLPVPLLRTLQEAIEQMKAEGLAGNRFRASDRMKFLKRQLDVRDLAPNSRKQSVDDLLLNLPGGKEILANESKNVRASERQAASLWEKQIARANNPMSGL